MNTGKMTDFEIYVFGVEFLINKLGPAGMMRFFWQCDPSDGNYSVDRHKRPMPGIDMIVKQIEQEN